MGWGRGWGRGGLVCEDRVWGYREGGEVLGGCGKLIDEELGKEGGGRYGIGVGSEKCIWDWGGDLEGSEIGG